MCGSLILVALFFCILASPLDDKIGRLQYKKGAADFDEIKYVVARSLVKL